MKKLLAVALSLCASVAFAELSSEPNACHWTGAVSGAWTEPGNWLESAVPGTGETAVFDRASGNTTIDFTGMSPVGKILVTGAETPSYTFGTAASQNLLLDQKGWIDVDETVTADQTFKATVCYFCEAQMRSSVYFRNNSSAVLKLSSYKGPVTGATGWMGAWNSYYYGSGRIQKIGNPDATSGGGANLCMCMDEGGVLEYTVSGDFYQIITDGTGTRQHIVIDAGCTLSSSNPSSVFAHGGNSDEVWLSGEGTFYLSDNSKMDADCCYLGSATASGVVTFDCKFKRRADNTTTFGFWNPTTCYFNCTNDISGGKLQYHGGGGDKKVYVGTFGSSDAPGALGSGTAAIQWDTSSSLIYTGAGDTLRNPLILNSTAKLYNNGTGTERIESEISGTGALNLYGGAFALACSVPNALSAEAGMSYAFVKKAGEESASYTVGKLVFNGQTELTLEDGVTVETVVWEQKSGAKLNIVTTGGKLVLTGLKGGAAPSWITVNRQPGMVTADGEIRSLDTADADVEIDARGGIVGDSETAFTSIETAEGEGTTVSLGAATTSAWILRQKQTVQPATVELKDGETLKVEKLHVAAGAKPLRIRSAEGASATLAGLKATGVTVTGDGVELGGNLTVGDVRLGHGGVLKVTDGEITGGTILRCPNDSDPGWSKAYYQTGGIVNTSGAGNRVGSASGYVYSEIADGEFNVSGAAYYGWSGLALLAVKGGTTTFSSGSMQLQASSGGFATVYQTGGVFQQTVHGLDVYVGGGENGNAVWTVEGEGAVTRIRSADDGRNFVLANGLSSSTATPAQAILNVNDGGTVHAGTIVASKNHPASAKALVNFNGGVFYDNYSYGRVFGEAGGQWFDPVDRVTLFEKGMTMQAGVDCSTKVPLDAPTGKGVASIAWTDTTTTFIGAPLVRIVGDGYGATAVAVFDSGTRTVSAIHVTSPGCDYTTATAQVLYGTKVSGGVVTIAEIPCVLKVNVSGGFTKTGGAKFTFSVTNTYAGATVVKAGTLQLDLDECINPKSALVLDGGTLNMNNKHQAFSSIACNGGKVTNGKPDVTGLAVDFDAAKAGAPLKVDMGLCTLADNAPVTMRNPTAAELEGVRKVVLAEFSNGVPASLDLSSITAPEDWEVVLRGNRLVLRKLLGMMLIVR